MYTSYFILLFTTLPLLFPPIPLSPFHPTLHFIFISYSISRSWSSHAHKEQFFYPPHAFHSVFRILSGKSRESLDTLEILDSPHFTFYDPFKSNLSPHLIFIFIPPSLSFISSSHPIQHSTSETLVNFQIH